MSRRWESVSAWSRATRTGYALTNVALNSLVVGTLLVGFGDVSLSTFSLWMSALIPVNILLHGWVWYPRSKARRRAETP